jgi:hypothetical protein
MASIPVAAVSAGGSGQCRVADRDLGHDEGRDHADLAAIVEDEDRAPAHFAAGAGGRRDGDDGGRAGGDAIGPAFDHGKALQRAVVCRADGDALADTALTGAVAPT